MKMLKRLAIVVAMVSSLVLLSGQGAQADELCLRASRSAQHTVLCVPML